MSPKLTLVVAVARNRIIGRDGALPWRLKSDMARFKAATMGKPVLMGRKTWDSLHVHPLPGRQNLVLTRDLAFKPEGAWAYTKLDAFLAAGAAMARSPALWPRLDAVRWISLGLALAAWLVMLAAPLAAEAVGPAAARNLARAGFGTMQWCGALAALGFAHRHWNREFAWRRYLTDAVFPVYIVHQTILIGLAMALRPAALGAGTEGALLVALTFALSLAVYECVRRMAWLRPWFGLARRRPAMPAIAPWPGQVSR